jgi:hypothetical protein
MDPTQQVWGGKRVTSVVDLFEVFLEKNNGLILGDLSRGNPEA